MGMGMEIGMRTRQTCLLLLLLLLALVSALLQSVSAAVSLAVSPRTLTKSNATVRVAWSGVSASSDLDWLGIYSPPNSRDDDFIGYVFLNSSVAGDWRSGAGVVEIPLVNLRRPYAFRLFRWTRNEVNYKHHDHDHNPLPLTRHRLAVSEVVRFEGSGGPDQIHLAFTDREDEMRVMFVTADGAENFVSYGLDSEKLDRMATMEVRRYEQKDMCDFPANSSIGWRDPGFIHDAVMKNLEKGKKYYYTVGSDAGGWSKIHSFMSRDSDSSETIAFLFGDMGTYTPYWTFYRIQEESKSTIKWILRDIEALGDKPAFVSHIGDISYARGFAWIWDEFFNQIEPIASKVPYHVCIGNHEYDWPSQPWKPDWSVYGVYGKDGGGECGVPYSVRFRMPGNSSLPTGTGSPDTRNLYYSFNAGVVHFLYISTETDFLQGSDQYKFIKADLESVNRSRTPFIVIQGHRPMYTTSNELRDAPLRERMLEHLEPLLVQNNVTLALWGHVHRYERFCPLKNFKCLTTDSNFTFPGAPVHVVIGMAGQDWQPVWEPRSDHPDVPIFPQPERSMYRGGEFGYTRLVATKEKLTLSYIGNHDGQVHDKVEILSGLQTEQQIVTPEEKEVDVDESTPHSISFPYPWYVKAAAMTMLGVFLGYAIGVLMRRKKEAAEHAKWAPVRNEEI